MKFYQPFFYHARQQPLWFYMVLLMVTLFCVIDFMQRVRLPLPVVSAEVYVMPTITATTGTSQRLVSDIMQQWLDSAAIADTQSANSQNTQPKPGLMPGATDLSGLLVRVRAVFIQGKSKQRIALIELQQTEDRKIVLQSIRPGAQIGAYQVVDILPDAVVFQLQAVAEQSEQTTVTIHVFQRPIE